MRRIYQADVADVATATGHGQVALGYLNDAVIEIFNKVNGRWYNLLKTRTYKTSFNAFITVIDGSTLAGSGSTITITLNGTATVLTEGIDWTGVASEETTATNIAAAVNASVPLADLTAVADGVDVTATVTTPVNLAGITAVATSAASTVMTAITQANGAYTLATDFGAFFIIKDIGNNRIIVSEWDKVIDFDDPDEDSIGTTLIYSVRTDHVRYYPKPDTAGIFKEAYWKLVTRLTANSSLYDLPEFCETAILKVAEGEMWYYLDKNSKGDRARGRAKILMEDAVETNNSILDRILMLEADFYSRPAQFPLIPPFLGSNFSHPYGF